MIPQLSETKIFTASNVAVAAAPPPQENVTITKGQRWVETSVFMSPVVYVAQQWPILDV